MAFSAKYGGYCQRCHGGIAVGEQIERHKPSGYAHVQCPEKSTALPKRSGGRSSGRSTSTSGQRTNGRPGSAASVADTSTLARGISTDASARRAGVCSTTIPRMAVGTSTVWTPRRARSGARSGARRKKRGRSCSRSSERRGVTSTSSSSPRAPTPKSTTASSIGSRAKNSPWITRAHAHLRRRCVVCHRSRGGSDLVGPEQRQRRRRLVAQQHQDGRRGCHRSLHHHHPWTRGEGAELFLRRRAGGAQGAENREVIPHAQARE